MPFVEKLRDGDDLVMGNRFKGGIAPGAMPPLHRYLGNPVLSFVGRLFFRAPVGDFHCGLRGFDRDAILALDLQTPGHGVRQRDGGQGDAAPAAHRRGADHAVARTAAAGRRTCAAGATAGGTCASCCCSARAGCSSIRASLLTVLALLQLTYAQAAHARRNALAGGHPYPAVRGGCLGAGVPDHAVRDGRCIGAALCRACMCCTRATAGHGAWPAGRCCQSGGRVASALARPDALPGLGPAMDP